MSSVYMGDRVDNSYSSMSSNSKESSIVAGKKTYNKLLVASRPKGFAQRNYEHLVSLTHGDFGSNAVGRVTLFLLKVAALETVRRFSKSKCPCVWRGLQGLQILVYPPFKWIQKWAPFRGLVKSMQALSRPLLVLSIATVFTDQPQSSDGTSDCVADSPDSEVSAELSPELSPALANLNTSRCEIAPEVLKYENWLTLLNQELENLGISLPGRINDDELRRFYTASNNDFSCFLTSIKKTISWRESYRFLTGEALEMWSNMVFWHGSDLLHRPCLIVRLGIACSSLASEDRSQFAQAVEYGVLHLVDAENPQITVLVDCEGLSPLRIPMKMLRSCSSLLQDHFPNRLGCLFVIRLPAIVRVIAQTFIQVLKPATKKKLKLGGERYQKILYDNFPTLPSYLGGFCTCMRCSKIGNWDMLQPHATGISRINREEDISDNEGLPPLHPSHELDGHQISNYDKLVRTAVVSIIVFWVFIALGAGIYYPGSRYLSS